MKKDLKREFKQAMKESRPEKEIGKMRQDFLTMIRLHNKVRKLDLKQKRREKCDQSQERFKGNPHKYAKDLLDNKNRQGEPEFSKEVADKFFKSTYRDKKVPIKIQPSGRDPQAQTSKAELYVKTTDV